MKGIVVGHWSQDGQLSHKQINQGHHNLFRCSEGDDSLQRELIETFSHDASTIIDATQSGKLLIKYLAHACTGMCIVHALTHAAGIILVQVAGRPVPNIQICSPIILHT